MSNKCLRLAAAMIGVVSLGLPARAQGPENTVTVSGEIHAEAGTVFNGLHVELSALDMKGDMASSDIQFDGGFTMRNVRPGTYMLFVRSFDGGVIHRDLVTVLTQMTVLTVNLGQRKNAAGAPGTISIKQLLHPPDRKALQAVSSAQHFAQSGQTEKAMEELEKAIRISPDYAEAYNNLGVQKMRTGKLAQACDDFRRALEITGPSALVLANLAIAQREMRQYPEAIESARAALRLDRSLVPAHLVLGAVLVVEPQTREEGVTHLKFAAAQSEAARVLLERVNQLQAIAR